MAQSAPSAIGKGGKDIALRPFGMKVGTARMMDCVAMRNVQFAFFFSSERFCLLPPCYHFVGQTWHAKTRPRRACGA